MPSSEDRPQLDQGAASSWNGFAGPRRDVRQTILILGIALIVLVALGMSLAVHELRLRDLNEERRTLTALDLLLVEETERSLQSVDLVLVNVSEKLAAEHIDTPQAFTQSHTGLATYEMLKSRVIGIPQLDTVSLINDHGQLVSSSHSFPAPKINVADRDYFRALKALHTDKPFISAPVRNRATGAWTIFLARRVTSHSGDFLGLVIGAINLSYFENLYETLRIGKGGAVSMWRSDGTLLARYPSQPGIGHQFKTAFLAGADQATQPLTYMVGKSPNGPARVIATMAARQFPIVVNVSKATNRILADWSQVTVIMAAGTLLFIVALAFVLWLLLRQFKTYDALAIAHEERSRAVAEREHAEAQLRQAQKLEAIGQLTGGIAHDFNNLLTAVLGNLDLVKKRTEHLDERLHRWASSAYDAANRGAALTQRLLVFSRRQPLDPRATDVATLLASMSDLLRRTLGENIEITTDVATGLWPAFADLNQLDNAILNIAINARDAMDGRGRLTISARNCVIEAHDQPTTPGIAPGQYVVLAITDTGKGIEEAVLERVFEPFFSTKPVGQGTGLGLSQVYGFVKQTGGHVQIHSEPGQGTTVELYLPRATQDELAEVVRAQSEEVVRTIGMGTILVVEDDADVRAYSAEILRELGFFVREAPNARLALDVLRSDFGIDLLFSDLGLPGMTGIELVDEALRLRPGLKVLLTTGYAQDKGFESYLSRPGVSAVAKPFGREALAQKIRGLLASSAQDCA